LLISIVIILKMHTSVRERAGESERGRERVQKESVEGEEVVPPTHPPTPSSLPPSLPSLCLFLSLSLRHRIHRQIAEIRR
jgi:hypothetical protein